MISNRSNFFFDNRESAFYYVGNTICFGFVTFVFVLCKSAGQRLQRRFLFYFEFVKKILSKIKPVADLLSSQVCSNCLYILTAIILYGACSKKNMRMYCVLCILYIL